MKEGWTYKKLGDECSILYGYPFDSKCFSTSPDDMPLIRIRDVKEGKTSTFYNGDYLKDYIIHKGDFLIGMDGEFNISPWQSEDALLNQRVCKISCNTSSLLIRYVYRFLIKELKKIEDETPFVTVKHLSAKKINQINIPVPPIAEQERIVSELDLLSGMIEKKKEQLKAYDQLAQSIFYTMFGDPIDNPKGFPLLTINDVIKFEGGSQPPKTAFEYTPSPDNIRLIQIRDYKTDDYITYIPKSLARRFCDEDDIMIGRYGPPIFQILKGIKGAYNVALMKAVPLEGNKEFIRAFLEQKCLLHYLENFARRVAGQDGIQMDKLKSYPFPYPPIEQQNLFAEKVEAIERQKALVQLSIEETQTMFDCTMDKYFG